MHTEGIEERIRHDGADEWFIRSECLGCGFKVGVDVPVGQTYGLVDRLIWTDDALHRLERMPPYLASLYRTEIDQDAQRRGERVIAYDTLLGPRAGEQIVWDAEAERRLGNVPAPVRTMAKIELERTAAERGASCVTVELMEEVKAKYFGMSNVKREA
jgi:hypothetical protein